LRVHASLVRVVSASVRLLRTQSSVSRALARALALSLTPWAALPAIYLTSRLPRRPNSPSTRRATGPPQAVSTRGPRPAARSSVLDFPPARGLERRLRGLQVNLLATQSRLPALRPL